MPAPTVLAGSSAAAPRALAHGLGGAGDLPVPYELVLYAVAGILVATAALLSARAARGRGRDRSRPVPPAALTALGERRWLCHSLRALTLAAGLAVAVIAAFGASEATLNPAPRLLLTVFWVGLLGASVLLGPVWWLCNPLRLLSAGLARAAGDPREAATRPLPDGLGWWAAAAGLLAFSAVELVFDDRPLAVVVFLGGYGLAQLAAAAVFGRDWFCRGDSFEAVSALVGRLSPLGRGADGRLRLRNPRAALASLRPGPGLLGVVAVLVGANLFDGVLVTPAWQRLVFGAGAAATLVNLAGLLGCVGAAWGLGAVAAGPGGFAPALVPLAVGYALAHYVAPLLVETQAALVLLSDPFARGWDLLGTAGRPVSYELLPGTLVASVQLTGFVAGHVGAVVVGHDLAVARYDLRAARAAQFPLRLVVLVSALGGIVLRYGLP